MTGALSLSSLSVEALSASVQLDDETPTIIAVVARDLATFEAIVSALRDDWLTIRPVRIATNARALAPRETRGPGADALWLDDSTSDAELARIDPVRTALLPKGMALLGCSFSTHERLRRSAPHFCSLVTQFAEVSVDDRQRERVKEAVLQQLRERYAMTDEQVIAAAPSELATSPDFALWLVLLGHGERLSSGDSKGGE